MAAIRQRHEGYVTIAGWWINGSSAGVTGLTLHEQPAPSSPTWAAVDRVATDLSVGAILRGRFMPRRIVFERASIAYRIDADGKPLTQIPLRQSGGGAIPELIVRDGELAMRQEGRPEMRVHHLAATMSPAPGGGPRFEVKADDPDWGHPGLAGRFTPDFSGFGFRLTADRLPADPEKARRVPFVEEKIWKYVEPHGPIGVVLDYQSARAGWPGRRRHDDGPNFEGTTVGLPTLGLTGEDATGRLSVRDKIVKLDDVRGRMAGGRVAFSGPIDFLHKPDRYDLAMDLDRRGPHRTCPSRGSSIASASAAGTPARPGCGWPCRPDGLDLTGSTGEGRVDGAAIRGIPLERLDLTLRGEGLRRAAGRGSGRRGRGPGSGPGEQARTEARPPTTSPTDRLGRKGRSSPNGSTPISG